MRASGFSVGIGLQRQLLLSVRNSYTRSLNARHGLCCSAVLYSNSTYFRTMLDSPMREASSAEIHHETYPYDVFSRVLRYVYTGNVDLDSEEPIAEQMYVGHT